MQSWPNQGQNGGDGQNSSDLFNNQGGQFDQGQAWPQPISEHDAYARQLNPGEDPSSYLHDPAMLHGFADNHASFDLGHQFSGQDVIDPAFNNIHPDLYQQQSKLGISPENLHHMNPVQGSQHGQSPGFSHHDYAAFASQNGQHFDSPGAQYSQPQILPQTSRQQTHTPVQQFSNTQPALAHAHSIRPTQQSPVQHQSPYSQSQSFSPAPQLDVGGQGLQYQQQHQSQHSNFQQAQIAYQQGQTTFSSQSPKPYAYQQQQSSNPSQPYAHHGQQNNSASIQQAMQETNPIQAAGANSAPPLPQPQPQSQQPIPDTPPKKRKRAPKPLAETVTTEGASKSSVTSASAQGPGPVPATVSSTSVPTPALAHATPTTAASPLPVDSTAELQNRRTEEIDSLPAPSPTPEELQLLQHSKKNKGSSAKVLPTKGLPYVALESTIKLPAPKSYDKLVPLVALPPRSKKPMVPEIGYALPCEIQGKFTNQYRPAFDKIGLDERRLEARLLLDEFDRSMKSLGKRRPKYTEYPHAFKEQLKSDEATKNKAEKKARKELEEEQNKPIRSAVRPSDVVEAAAWDAIGIVYIEPSVTKTSTLVAGRVQQAGDLFIKLRGEMNQAKQDVDHAIKQKEPEAKLSDLKTVSEQKKMALYRALDATLDHADDSVINNLGGHQKLILSLVNVLIGCIKATDFSGKLPKIVLELFTHFPMTKKIAETTNFDTVRKRFADKGDNEVKKLVEEISAKVKKVLKPEAETATGYTGTSAASRAAKTSSKSAASNKRTREDDTTAERIIKKVAVEPGSGSLSKKLAQPKLQLQSASKTTASKAAASSILPGKTRPVSKPAGKTEPMMESGATATDEKVKTEAKKAVKVDNSKTSSVKPDVKLPTPKMAAAPSSSALSGIASLLDSINAPRSVTPPAAPAKETKGPEAPETAEEKAKRLRKESRRKLRVSWKPESELVQVKLFEKEDDEDEGRDDNMIRDAGDDRSEGMVLKQRVDVEEDDDDDDVPYQPWLEPSPMDFSILPDDVRNKSYTTRGGNVSFKTNEQNHIAEREQRELMAIYAGPDDIPPTPKSPPLEATSTSANPKQGNIPYEEAKFQELHLRWRDERQMGVDGALYSATQRLIAKSKPSSKEDNFLGRLQNAPQQAQLSHTPSPQHVQGGTDTNVALIKGSAVTEQVLAWLKSAHVKGWMDPQASTTEFQLSYNYKNPEVQVSGNIIEHVVKNLAHRPYPADTPPEWLMSDDERVREWWVGHNKEMAIRQARADEERARVEAEANALRMMAIASGQGQNAQDWAAYYAQQQQQQQPQNYPDPYMAILQQLNSGQPHGQPQSQQQPAQPSSTQISDPQLQSILAAMGQGRQQQQPAKPESQAPANNMNPNDPSVQQLMRLMTSGPHSQNTGNDYEPDRYDRDRHDEHNRNDHFGRGKDNRKKKPGPSTVHKPANVALIGTKPCTFWQQGKCARGDKCTFRHD